MKIGGLLKFSLIDYPKKVAAVIFTQGCNFRCPYCHNPELVLPERFQSVLSEEDVLAFLEKRQGQLQGVVVTGGEPTMQKDLLGFLQKIKQLDYDVKLDTNGSHPKVLKEAIHRKVVDFVAMDIKAPLEKYKVFTLGYDYSAEIQESISVIMSSSLPYEFRTTFVKSLISDEDRSKMSALIKGVPRHRFQEFVSRKNILDPALLQREEEFSRV